MSTYETYNEVCSKYDIGRQAVGTELYTSFLSSLKQPLDRIHVLDAGCGTGNFSAELLRKGVGMVTLFDASEGMLKVARQKVAKFGEERFQIVHSSLPDLPFGGDTYDAVMFNFVLHHLEDGSDKTFQNHVKALTESYRVLKPGGLLLVQTLSHFQLRECLWWNAFVPLRALDAMADRYMLPEEVQTSLKDIGFVQTLRYSTIDELFLSKDAHLDFNGILRKDWRDMHSGFSLCTPEEIDDMVKKVSDMMKDGTFYKVFDKQEENRRNAGAVTILIAMKPH